MAGDELPEGGTIETAIVILTSDPGDGVNQEYRHIGRLFGVRLSGWYPVGQWLIRRDGRTYDRIDVQVGQRVWQVYFDITSFMPE